MAEIPPTIRRGHGHPPQHWMHKPGAMPGTATRATFRLTGGHDPARAAASLEADRRQLATYQDWFTQACRVHKLTEAAALASTESRLDHELRGIRRQLLTAQAESERNAALPFYEKDMIEITCSGCSRVKDMLKARGYQFANTMWSRTVPLADSDTERAWLESIGVPVEQA